MNTMHRFELWTEAKGKLVELASEIFPNGYTIYDSLMGIWKGTKENSVCLVVVAAAGQDAELARVSMRELAKRINTANNQQATLMLETIGWGESVTERF